MWIILLTLLYGIIQDPAVSAQATWAHSCQPDLFRCGEEIAPGKWCISKSWVCDGEKDCPDGLDEQQNCPPPTCASNRFQCEDLMLCIPQGWLCDGEKDCIDGSDEALQTCSTYKKEPLPPGSKGAEEPFECPPDQYLCSGSRLCVHYDVFCNGRVDCPNGDDEGPHCREFSCLSIKNPSNPLPCPGKKCTETQKGAVCYCNRGYFYNVTTGECQDLDECLYESFCDQQCSNTVGSVTCQCQEGYTLEDDNKSCHAVNTPINKETYLVMSDVDGVYRLLKNGSQPQQLAPQCTAFDIDFDKNEVCMIQDDGEVYKLVCTNIDSRTNYTILLKYPVSSVAYDWIAQNWYFTDEKHERIILCNRNATHCMTILNTELKGPKAIAVDPLKGYLFFTTLGETPKLERSLLDGTERVVLVRDKIVRPQFLALDVAAGFVYWADAYLERLERVRYDGAARRLVVQRQWAENVEGLDVFEGYLYLTSQRNGTLTRIPVREDIHTPSELLYEEMKKPGQVRVFHRQRQPKPDSYACQYQMCDHICVPLLDHDYNSVTALCYCSEGYQPDINSNPTQCIPVYTPSTKKFLLYSNEKLGEIKAISLDPAETYEMIPPIGGLERPVAVDFHKEDQFIYYSDTMKIGRQKLDGTQRNDKFITTGVSNCEGIAIDWIGRNIYWTDEGLKTINVAKLDNSTIWKPLIKGGMSHPLAIVVQPSLNKKGGYMYWTDWVQKPSSVDAKIMRAHMDGTNQQVLVNKTIQWPHGLSLDLHTNMLYWCDAYTDRIESLDLDDPFAEGSRKLLLSGAKNLKHPYGLAHTYIDDKHYFYWTEFMDGQIKRHSLSSDGVSEVVRNESFPLHEIRVYDTSPDVQGGASECSSHNCSQLCLTVPTGRVCACMEGMLLDTKDNITCTASANRSTSRTPKCGKQEFQCRNGNCINTRWTCDGDTDCSDNSDEDEEFSNCSSRACPDEKLMYKCSNNRCIYKRWMCDGEDDCRNGEDEDPIKCDRNGCSNEMTRCPKTHRCIPKSWLCDHDNDCGDGFDEQDCSYNKCREDQFTCGNQRCISQEYVCDGDNDCRDNTDEEGCQVLSCSTTDSELFFPCVDTSTCLRRIYVCDGEENCNDGSDEWNCTTGPAVDHHSCKLASQYRCNNGLCVPIQLQCDGDDDCGDNSDEEQCHNITVSCNDDFKCLTDNRCIPSQWKCDTDIDCEDGSDESVDTCDGSSIDPVAFCPYPNYLCPNTTVCTKREHLCDGKTDCEDGSDESSFCDIDLCPFSGCDFCSMGPTGQICYCPEGLRLKEDNKTCEDASPCSLWGVCSQKCISHQTSHKCDCMDGYRLKDDRFTCAPIDNITQFIFFSNRHEIRRLDVKKQTYVSLVSGLRNTIALDFSYNHNSSNGDGSIVFWTDVVDDKIYRGKLVSNSITTIHTVVNVGLATAEGLAVDWITEHLYWVESNLDQIEVANFNGTQRTTLIAGEMESPRAIVVDPRHGILFWSDWDASFPRIEKCSMSGKDRKVIFNVTEVNGAGWPNGLTVDYEATRLYWIDAKSDSIHTVEYDGSDHRIILHGHEFLSHPFAISVFGNNVYWTDWRTNSLVQANKWNGTQVQVIQKTITQPFDLHIFHPRRQPIVPNPCANNSGGCEGEAICLLGYDRTAECRCPHLMKLNPDNKSCEFDGIFLLFSKKQEIRGVDLESYFNVIPALTVPFVYNPLALDYYMDHDERRLYWIDDDIMHGVFGVQSATLSGTGFETIIDSAMPNPRAFAIDWVSRNMYFSWFKDEPEATAAIEVATLSGAFRTSILTSENKGQATLRKPNYIVLHPVEGFMFWSDMSDGSINRAEMDGSNAVQLFNFTETGVTKNQPHCLTIDFDEGRLWWVSVAVNPSLQGNIMSCKLDGTDRKQIDLSDYESIGRIGSIALHGDTIYFSTEGKDSSINKMNKRGKQFEVLKKNTPGISAMKMFDSQRGNDSTNGCANNSSGCSQLCLPTQSGHTCKCTVGFQPLGDGSCTGIKSFLLFSSKTEVRGVPLPDNNSTVEADLALAPISKIATATAIDFHAEEDYIYWVDSSARKISRIKRDLTMREVLIEDRMVGVEGLAIDWVANNMYWTDQVKNVIEVARTNGSNRFVVVHGNITKPRSIVVNPLLGKMYWTESGIHPKIMAAGLDGSSPQVLVTQGVLRPYGLTINFEEGSEGALYWCDQTLNQIHKVDLATNVTSLVEVNVTDCMGLTVFKNSLYWIDVDFNTDNNLNSSNNGGSLLYKPLSAPQSVKPQTLLSQLGAQPRDLKMFHKDRQPAAEVNECQVNNGGCENLCFYRANSADNHLCQCAHGRLNDDGRTCKDHTKFLAFSTVTNLVTVHMSEGLLPNSPHPDISNATRMKNVIGLTFDYANQRYFFSDIQHGDIQTVFFNGTGFRTIVDSIGSAEGLAYDPVFHELYWTSYTNSSISRISVSMRPRTTKAKPEKVIQLGPEDHPRAIVIDSCNSRMYWTNWKDKEASIQSSYLSGYDLRSIITTDIQSPNGLTIDFQAKKLYWSDARLDKIERCDLDGSNRKLILGVVPQHVFGLTVYADDLYWTDWVLRAVIRVNKYTGLSAKYMYKNVPRQPMGIVAVANDSLNCEAHVCSLKKGGCEHACDVDEYGDRVCSCRSGYSLQEDNVSCSDSTADPCMPNEFKCRDGTCIDFSLTCDNTNHCLDSTDENVDYCSGRICPTGFFKCSNNRCILQSLQCNGQNDCGDGTDERKCTGCIEDEEFQCGDGACILQRYRCDHDKDCQDASDEIGCNRTDCSVYGQHARMVPCNMTTACIMPSWRCDGHDDCWDNSDEEGCDTDITPNACDDGWFKCAGSSDCIPLNWKCDGDYDCTDKSDEQHCRYKCGANQFACTAGAGVECIPSTWRCDGRVDCINQTDEIGCDEFKCNETEYTCRKTTGLNDKCVPKTWLCDGHKDCPEGDDELPRAGCDPIPCNEDEIRCDNFQCILKTFLCDQDDDCGDNSDEPPTCVYDKCDNATEFQCSHQHQCIPRDKYCDGKLDCFDHTDEDPTKCLAKYPCGSDQKFMCDNGVCISNSNVCDQRNDCGDSSDELQCGINECELGNPCGEHICKDLNIGFACTCKKGYTLNKDGKTCEDINECELLFPCTHYCFNTHGSYKCSCAEQFVLAPDKRTCKASSQAKLLVSNRYYIRNMTTNGSKIDLLAMDLNNAVALDFDWSARRIFWSDVTSTGSSISSMDFNGTESSKTVIHNSTLRNPDGIAVDWLGRNLYWCDKTTDTIEVSTLTGLYRKVLVRLGLQEPRALAVHPYRGWLFYTDWGDDAHIGRMGMDGSQRKAVVTEKLGWPNALTIDYITDHIYWADARLDYICMADLDGQNPKYIIREDLPHVFALSVFENHIYWTDWEYKSVIKAHKYSGANRTTVTTMIHRPMDVQVFHPLRQMQRLKKEASNPCENNGGCATGALCLINPGGNSRTCMCPERHYLSLDKTTCISNCTSSEFLCDSTYKCIPFWWKCDTQNDCGDMSDEHENCTQYYCKHPGLFQCANATSSFDCTSPTQICDGVKQCWDGSDEYNCDAHTCLDSQFKCSDPPKCIPRAQRCDTNYDCDDHSDEKDCPVYSCTANQFQCANKRCIPYVWRCDHDNDCGDKSDEPDNCTNSTCLPDYIKCNKSGRCVPKTWMCDGDKDCGNDDDSDEPPECSHNTCQPTYFKCENTRCIPGRWQCDYDDDCRDGSDEANCPMRNCSESEWMCADKRCIRKEFKCDGITQCTDGSDELNCTVTCTDDEFMCGEAKHCIPKDWLCDRDADCNDASDEVTCNVHNVTCTKDEYKCGNGMCIPFSWRCDGDNDCFDAQDENVTECSSFECLLGYHRCDGHKCVPNYHMCDGVQHCKDNTDENQCNKMTCTRNQFQCRETGQCIPKKHRCDGVNDCVDRTDETDCDHMCRTDSDCHPREEVFCDKADNLSAGNCECHDGYERTYSSRSCNRIDYCALPGTCSQLCTYKNDFHKCECMNHYVQAPGTGTRDNRTCKAEGERPYLVSVTENEILAFSLLQRSPVFRKLYNASKSSNKSVRFDSVSLYWPEQLIYITDYHTPAIWTYTVPITLDDDKDKRVKRDADKALQGRLDKLKIDNLGEPRGIAVDWLTQNLYWTDSKQGKIFLAEHDGTSATSIVDTNLDHPYALIVDPMGGRLYWSLWGSNAKIETSKLDGSDRKVLINKEVEWPAGIALDIPSQRLYWTDTKRRTIESAAIDQVTGEAVHRVKVKTFGADEEPPFKINVFEDKIYYSTFKTHDVYWINKFEPSDPALVVKGTVRIGDILVVQQFKQPNYSEDVAKPFPCSNSSELCSTICLNVPDKLYNKSYTCLCPDHQMAAPNGQCEHTGEVAALACETDDYCLNGGSCRLTEKGEQKCHCTDQFYGDRCQKDACYDYCLNGGTCLPQGKGKATCSCSLKYTGDRCEIYKCTNYCKNAGLCTVSSVTEKMWCKCHAKFTGDLCDIETVHPCENLQCYNEGKCTIRPGDGRSECQCNEGYTGDQCEQCAEPSGGYSCTSGDEVLQEAAYCTYNNTIPQCICPKGYSSVHVCDEDSNSCQDKCERLCTDYCMNGGTCTHNKDTLQPQCTCTQRYTGDTCEVDRCMDRCKHGECVEAAGKLQCHCDNGWEGHFCNETTKCERNPCHGKSTCVANPDGSFLRCECPLGYEGLHCHQLHGCEIVTCLNGGSCQEVGSDFICNCRTGWMGDTCATEIPQVCSEYCLNSGQCVACDVKSTEPSCTLCRCDEAHMGDRCEELNPHVTSTPAYINILAIVIPIILCIALILVIIGVLIYRRRANNQFKHQRMADGSNMEINNPIYMKDYDDDDADGFSFDGDKRSSSASKDNITIEPEPTNFSNPMYDTLYNESSSDLQPESEKKQLLKSKDPKLTFYGEDDPPDTSYA